MMMMMMIMTTKRGKKMIITLKTTQTIEFLMITRESIKEKEEKIEIGKKLQSKRDKEEKSKESIKVKSLLTVL